MPSSREHLGQRLRDFDFRGLLIEELGWDRHQQTLDIPVDGTSYAFEAVAEKKGFAVYVCKPRADGTIPEYAIRHKIDRQVTKHAREHLLIFHDAAKTEQVWQWVRREPGKSIAPRQYSWRKGQANEALIQRLQAIEIALQEEESLVITSVAGKVRKAFDVEKVTKRFYERFQQEHKAFLKFIQGIQEQTDREWYASLMLNRMMFIYFIQKKGFLDGDQDYLRNRLGRMKQTAGKGKFHRFYRLFLLRLFHEGLGAPEADRAPDLAGLLGKVPYLNGGLFDPHELEQEYPKIEIPDEAFEKLFDFFDAYQWHLDERPLRADNEINPDVLGYIFEKYINQKEMGAYYTKEDITGYIARNTIIPHLFDVARKECPIAFKPDGGVWRLLRENPDRYLWPSVRLGVIGDDGSIIPETMLPDFVQKGMHDPKTRMFDRRYNLAEADFQDATGNRLTLPTETWREYVSRRRRCLEIRGKLQSGEVQAINDFITYNLDLCQFAEDAISNSEGPELVRAFWKAIRGISVLDPTCGSGAFLFAALNILEPVYEACLGAMQGFLEDLERRPEKHDAKKLGDFRKILDEASAAKHANQRYFVLKSIVLGNLYGVDIMAEAVEICKLRLFLKLVAQLERYDQIEPLPDIDFNIRAGNTLVGFTSLDAVQRAMTEDTDGRNVQTRGLTAEDRKALQRIQEEAEIADRAFRQFHDMQTERGMDAGAYHDAKAEVRKRLAKLGEQLDHHLAVQYGINPEKPGNYEQWRASHQPFHWLAEFYGIMQRGGFDVIIGNPPYVEVPKSYDRRLLVGQYETALESWSRDEDLYTFVVERSLALLAESSGGFGMILPLSITFSTKKPFAKLRRVLNRQHGHLFLSHFDRIPSALFGNEVRTRCTVAIFAQTKQQEQASKHTTALRRWQSEYRDVLFQTLAYARLDLSIEAGIPKVGSNLQAKALEALVEANRPLSHDLNESIAYSQLARVAPKFPQPCVFIGGTAYNWFPVWRDIPETTTVEGKPSLPARTIAFRFRDKSTADTVFALLCSSMGYWWWAVASDGFNLKRWLVERFPISLMMITDGGKEQLALLGQELRAELQKHYVYKDNKGRIGNYFLPACSETIAAIDTVLAKSVRGLSEEAMLDIGQFNADFSRAEANTEEPDDD